MCVCTRDLVYNNLVARLPFGSSQSCLGMSTAMLIVAATGLAVASTVNPFFFFFFFSLVSESEEEGGGGCSGGVGFWVFSFFPS